MDAVLMRRFVRYHKLVVTFGNDELDLGVRMIANELHGSATDENVIAVVQALTRIDDAEEIEAARKRADVAGGYAVTERWWKIAGIDDMRRWNGAEDE